MAMRWKGKHKGLSTVTPLSQAPPGELFSSICFPGDIRTVNTRCAVCTWTAALYLSQIWTCWSCWLLSCFVLYIVIIVSTLAGLCWWSTFASFLNFLHNSIDSNCNTQLVCAEFALDIVQWWREVSSYHIGQWSEHQPYVNPTFSLLTNVTSLRKLFLVNSSEGWRRAMRLGDSWLLRET